jgi:hypothetical protein
MDTKLSPKQLLVAVVLFLSAVGFMGYRYFTAPDRNAEPGAAVSPLAGTYVSELRFQLASPLAPPHIPAQVRKTSPADLVVATPRPDEAQAWEKEQKRLLQLGVKDSKRLTEAVAYLRREGVSITADQPFPTAPQGRAPLTITIIVQDAGYIVEGQPTWGALVFRVQLQRDVYLTKADSHTVRVILPTDGYELSGDVGIATPETLEPKREEAVGKALEAFATAWKKENQPKTETSHVEP